MISHTFNALLATFGSKLSTLFIFIFNQFNRPQLFKRWKTLTPGRINIHPLDSAIGFLNTCPLDNDLSGPSCAILKVDSAMQRINLYLVDSAIGFPNIYPRDNGLSGG